MELVIDGFANPIHKVKSGILQESLLSSILFLIHIRRVFSMIENQLPNITYLLFIDNLRLLTAIYWQNSKDTRKSEKEFR